MDLRRVRLSCIAIINCYEGYMQGRTDMIDGVSVGKKLCEQYSK